MLDFAAATQFKQNVPEERASTYPTHYSQSTLPRSMYPSVKLHKVETF